LDFKEPPTAVGGIHGARVVLLVARTLRNHQLPLVEFTERVWFF
jgi:hypothetical protein